MSATIGDDTTPVYRFKWSDGTVRRTDEGIGVDSPNTTAVETLAEIGRQDPDCNVDLVGFK